MEETQHEPTSSYFYIARKLANCMMRADKFNLNVEPVRTKITGTQHILISHVCDLDESESKMTLVVEKSSQFCSTEESESESVIVNESYTEEI